MAGARGRPGSPYWPGSGGAREGAGRPAVGERRTVALTLPNDVWQFVHQVMYDQEMNQTQALRYIIEKAKETNDAFMSDN